MLWEEAWKRSLGAICSELLQSLDGTLDAFGDIITMDHLSSKGAWAQPKGQAKALNQSVLEWVRGDAEKAFNSLPTCEPQISFSNIKQLTNESFVNFIDRWKTN